MLKIPEDEFLTVVEEMCSCDSCELRLTRTQVVPYRGDPRTNLMVVGEAPGFEEDKKGLAMVGRTGSYLVDLLAKNGFPVESIYITNCLLCRPPENADPGRSQLEACAKWLMKNIEMVDPKVILAVGRFACARLIPEIMSTKPLMTKIEGMFFQSMYFDSRFIVPLRHPSAIPRQPTLKDPYERIIAAMSEKIREKIA